MRKKCLPPKQWDSKFWKTLQANPRLFSGNLYILILQLKKLSASDSSIVIGAVIRKAANPALLGFYSGLSFLFVLIQSYPGPKALFKSRKFQRNSRFSRRKAPEEIITIHMIRNTEEVWKDCFCVGKATPEFAVVFTIIGQNDKILL